MWTRWLLTSPSKFKELGSLLPPPTHSQVGHHQPCFGDELVENPPRLRSIVALKWFNFSPFGEMVNCTLTSKTQSSSLKFGSQIMLSMRPLLNVKFAFAKNTEKFSSTTQILGTRIPVVGEICNTPGVTLQYLPTVITITVAKHC